MKTSSRVAAWLASFSAICGLFIYAVAPDKTTPAIILGSLTILNVLFLGIVERENIYRALKTRAALHGTNSLILITVFLGILVFDKGI